MRVDERTEISMTRHHLQSGVSGVERGRLLAKSNRTRTMGETKRRPITANRTATGVSSGAGLGRFVGRRRKWCAAATPARPPPHPPPPPPPCKGPSAKPPENPEHKQNPPSGPRG